MDAAMQAEMELMALEGLFTLLSVDPIYENDDGDLAYNSDMIADRFKFLADVIERIEVAANATDSPTLGRLARLVGSDDAAALRKLSEIPAVRRAFAPAEITVVGVRRSLDGKVIRSPEGEVIRTKPEKVKLKHTAIRTNTRKAEANEQRRKVYVENLMESKGLSRKDAEARWRDSEMKQLHPNLHPGTPAYRNARKAMRQCGYRAKDKERRLAQSKQ